MITVRIRTTDGRISSYEVSGHAEYAEHGKDIVCGIVSALTMSAARSLQDYLGKEGIYNSENGYAYIEISDTDEKTEAILRTMKIGLKALEKDYPKNLRLIEIRG